MKTDNKQNFEKLISTAKSGWLKKALWREANEKWLERSALIAIKILSILKEKGISQKLLAETMGLSTQYVSKVLKGSENLSLETISKFEMALDVELIEIKDYTVTMSYAVPLSQQLMNNTMVFNPKTWRVPVEDYSNEIYYKEEAA